MEKRIVSMTVTTTESVEKRLANIRAGIPFKISRSSLAHDFLNYLTAKIEEGELSLQQVYSTDSVREVRN